MGGVSVVALIRSAADQTSARAGAGDSLVKYCSNAERAALAIADSSAVAVVLELDDNFGGDLCVIQTAIARRVPTIPLLIRLDLRTGMIRKMLEHDATAFDVRFSLRGLDDLSECLSRLLLTSSSPTAHHAIVSQLLRHARRSVLDIVVGAAIAGDRRSTVRQLTGLLNISQRSMEERLANAGCTTAKKLLMRMLALHTHWRISRLEWTTKRAAHVAGFESVTDLSRRIERAVGLTLTEMCATRSFDDELSRLAIDLT